MREFHKVTDFGLRFIQLRLYRSQNVSGPSARCLSRKMFFEHIFERSVLFIVSWRRNRSTDISPITLNLPATKLCTFEVATYEQESHSKVDVLKTDLKSPIKIEGGLNDIWTYWDQSIETQKVSFGQVMSRTEVHEIQQFFVDVWNSRVVVGNYLRWLLQ